MTSREIASLWIIGIGAAALIVWDYRNQLNAIVGAITGAPSPGSAKAANTINPGPSTNLTTNAATPLAGNEFGFLQTYGNSLSGDVVPGGPGVAFGSIWNDL